MHIARLQIPGDGGIHPPNNLILAKKKVITKILQEISRKTWVFWDHPPNAEHGFFAMHIARARYVNVHIDKPTFLILLLQILNDTLTTKTIAPASVFLIVWDFVPVISMLHFFKTKSRCAHDIQVL